MGYVEQNLLAGENIVHQAKLHWFIFVKSFLAFALLLIIAIVSPPDARAIWLGLTLIPALYLFSTYISYVSSEFAVTNKRVIIKTGLIRRHTLEQVLSKIEGIGVDQGIFGRLLNYGTIVVTGTGGTKNPYPSIAAPLEFRRKVQGVLSA